jgi:hypothetical protein
MTAATEVGRHAYLTEMNQYWDTEVGDGITDCQL